MKPLYCSQGHNNDPSNRFCSECGQRLPLSVGQVLEKRYRIVSHLGQGGFGRTYLAEDLNRFNDRCVLKEFAPQVQGTSELQKAKELFEREAGTLHRLKHPQLPGFWELFQVDMGGGIGCLFLVQDYVEGQTYFDLLNSGKQFSEAEVVQLLHQMLPVLSYIHSKNVIHRDISPDNIILRQSDNLPVLIDFGCVKQIAATAVSKFTNLGVLPTRLGKKGYAPEEQMRKGQVFFNSDLYSLAVTALVLLTGKEPQHLYDTYQGAWLWGKEINVSPQLQAVLQKMVTYKPSDRFSSADEVLKALPSPPPSTNSNLSQTQTNVAVPNPAPKPVAFHAKPISPVHRLNAIVSNLHTLVIAPKAKPNIAPATPAPITPHANNPVIPKPHQFFSGPVAWGLKLGAGTAFVLVSAMAGWTLMNSVIRSMPLGSVVKLPNTAPTTSSSSSEQNRTNQILSRRNDLEIPEAFFNEVVNELFYAQHPEVRGRNLTLSSEDAALREAWQNTAEDLLDKLEQAQLSEAARRKLGSYVQQNYETWKRQAQRGELGGYTIDQLAKQTDEKFSRLFPDQQGQQLNLDKAGQIWYAIAADKVRQVEEGKR
jgi:serine/threonine-protein kinase